MSTTHGELPYPIGDIHRRVEKIETELDKHEDRLTEGLEFMARIDERVGVLTAEIRGVKQALWALLAMLTIAVLTTGTSVVVNFIP